MLRANVSNFPQKQFEGVVYEFNHLNPIETRIALNADGTQSMGLYATFGCHCFTETFKVGHHQDHHRYTHKGELRAFDVTRYECSLQLPHVMQAMLKGRVYNAVESYTYAAHITLVSLTGPQSYSVFFSLEKDRKAATPAVRMFVKSAYLKPNVAKPNAQGWRFVSLAGQIAGVFQPKDKKPRPQKKKAP